MMCCAAEKQQRKLPPLARGREVVIYRPERLCGDARRLLRITSAIAAKDSGRIVPMGLRRTYSYDMLIKRKTQQVASGHMCWRRGSRG